jgi:hypothetical protein
VKAAEQNGSLFVPAEETRAHGSTRMPARRAVFTDAKLTTSDRRR